MTCPCMRKFKKSMKHKRKSYKNKNKKGGKNKKSLKKCSGDIIKDSKNKKKYCVGLCPHAQGHVNLFGNKFICSRHGAQFDIKGNVLKGPAISPLHVRQIK